MSAASILHADVDAFFASVARRDDPDLRDRPTIVGAGVVMACSYEAKRAGVHGGMSGAKARRLCPAALVVDPDFDAYVAASRALFEVLDETSPDVEGVSMEEAFLDVRGLERISGTPHEIAQRLRERVREHVGLPISVGAGTSKIVAKMASRAAKPDGLRVIEPGRELEFLHPLAVGELWGVGAATAARLHELGIRTVGDVAAREESELVTSLGRYSGRHLHAVAHGRDPRRVHRRRDGRRSFGAQSALGRRARSAAELDAILLSIVDRVTRRMRRARRVGRTVVLRLRFGDYSRATRSLTLGEPTAATEPVLGAVRRLFAQAGPLVRSKGLTLLGVAVSNLERGEPAHQLRLPVGPRAEDVDQALDGVRDRFGVEALTRASLVRPDRRGSSSLTEADSDAWHEGGKRAREQR